MGFVPSPATEDLASFLQGLPPGAHVAVNLGDLDMGTAMDISRQVADRRGERFLLIGHRSTKETAVARALGDALPLEQFVTPASPAFVIVDAAMSVETRGAHQHALAERKLGLEVGPRLTVVCFYTEAALAQVDPGNVHELHSLVAVPGQV